MSSPGYPTLNIDVSARRGERYVACIAVAVTLCAAALLFQQSLTAGSIAAAATALVTWGLARAGWFGGPRSTSRVVWQSEGQWLLTNERGQQLACELGGSSRVTPHVVWLDWVHRSAPPLLLLPGDVPEVDFRRLVVRLRLTQHSDRRGVVDEP